MAKGCEIHRCDVCGKLKRGVILVDNTVYCDFRCYQFAKKHPGEKIRNRIELVEDTTHPSRC